MIALGSHQPEETLVGRQPGTGSRPGVIECTAAPGLSASGGGLRVAGRVLRLRPPAWRPSLSALGAPPTGTPGPAALAGNAATPADPGPAALQSEVPSVKRPHCASAPSALCILYTHRRAPHASCPLSRAARHCGYAIVGLASYWLSSACSFAISVSGCAQTHKR